jgi:hypothetical protein
MEDGKATTKTTARWILLVFWLWAIVPLSLRLEDAVKCPPNYRCCGAGNFTQK